MLPYQRQQFDFLLQVVTERFVERLEQRHGGCSEALDHLRADPEGEGVWLAQFVDAVFADFLLDNPEGASFILLALKNRPMTQEPSTTTTTTIGAHLEQIARRAFRVLLLRRGEEALEQGAAYQAVVPPGGG